MTIHFAGTHPSFFGFTGDSPALSTQGSAYYDTAYSDCAIGIASNDYLHARWNTKETDLWVSWSQRQYPSLVTASHEWVTFYDGETAFARLRADASRNLEIQTWVGSTWVTQGNIGGNIESNVLGRFAVHVVFSDTVGFVEAFWNGVSIGATAANLDTTGDGAITGCDHFDVRSNYNNTLQNHYLSEIVVANEDCRDYRVFSKGISGNGTNTGFTGGFADVGDFSTTTGADDDYITAASADLVSTFTKPATPSSAHVVKAVAVANRARRGATGPQNLQHAIRTNGANYVGSTQSLTEGFENIPFTLWETNPATASAFTQAEADALEVGVKSIT